MTILYDFISSPIGELLIIASDTELFMAEFADSEELEIKKRKIEKIYNSKLKKGTNSIITQATQELTEYFSGKRKIFTIPLSPYGTEFQKKAWQALGKIPYGETRSYLEEATMIGNPKAVRAIGGANHNNPIVIIIPCHRVIGKSGKLVGYGGGIDRKIWLLEHEKNNS